MNREALERLREKWRKDWPHREGMDLFHDGLALLDALLEDDDPNGGVSKMRSRGDQGVWEGPTSGR